MQVNENKFHPGCSKVDAGTSKVDIGVDEVKAEQPGEDNFSAPVVHWHPMSITFASDRLMILRSCSPTSGFITFDGLQVGIVKEGFAAIPELAVSNPSDSSEILDMHCRGPKASVMDHASWFP